MYILDIWTIQIQLFNIHTGKSKEKYNYIFTVINQNLPFLILNAANNDSFGYLFLLKPYKII